MPASHPPDSMSSAAFLAPGALKEARAAHAAATLDDAGLSPR